MSWDLPRAYDMAVGVVENISRFRTSVVTNCLDICDQAFKQ